MAYEPEPNPFTPLVVGAFLVMLALVAFLVVRGGPDTTQQALVKTEPPATTSGPATAPRNPPAPGAVPTTPPASAK